jgi:hypothetical protein
MNPGSRGVEENVIMVTGSLGRAPRDSDPEKASGDRHFASQHRVILLSALATRRPSCRSRPPLSLQSLCHRTLRLVVKQRGQEREMRVS